MQHTNRMNINVDSVNAGIGTFFVEKAKPTQISRTASYFIVSQHSSLQKHILGPHFWTTINIKSFMMGEGQGQCNMLFCAVSQKHRNELFVKSKCKKKIQNFQIQKTHGSYFWIFYFCANFCILMYFESLQKLGIGSYVTRK